MPLIPPLPGSSDETIRLLDLHKRCELGALMQHSGTVTCLAFHGQHLLSGSEDGTICVYQCGTWECQKVMKGHNAPITQVPFYQYNAPITQVPFYHNAPITQVPFYHNAPITQVPFYTTHPSHRYLSTTTHPSHRYLSINTTHPSHRYLSNNTPITQVPFYHNAPITQVPFY